MSASLEWTEWHLTPEGWKRGTIKSEKGIQQTGEPVGSVARFQYVEDHSGYGRDTSILTHTSSPVDLQAFEHLISLYGTCPTSL